MTAKLIFDYTNLLSATVGEKRGIPEADLAKYSEASEEILREAEAGWLPFRELPYREDYAESVKELLAGIPSSFHTLVNLGIGGSSLGGNALVSAAGDAGPENRRNVLFPENIDPVFFHRVLRRLDLEHSLFSVVSKSGSTAETAAQFLVVRDELIRRFGMEGYRERVVVTTDPEKGDLAALAGRDGLRKLPFPEGVGGRFSVLSPVGLLPAAFAGIPIDQVLAGARAMDVRCRAGSIPENPAMMIAVLFHLSAERGRRTVIFWPYSELLVPAADWFRQIWAESLGKKLSSSGSTVHAGQTPVRAVGVTDQHSQLQLYIEGPFDKIVCFLAVNDYGTIVEIPDSGVALSSFKYLQGKSLNDLIRAEEEATEMSLARAGRPNCKLVFPQINAFHMGEYFYLLEVATAFSGSLSRIDPFDQPGVEEGKRFTYGLLGREGYEDRLQEILAWRKKQRKTV